nr:putative NTE family protein [uncultured bacterium]
MTSEPVPSRSAASALLSLCRLFADADPEALGEVASELQLVSLIRGELLIRQGDPADCMYAIVSGRLELTALADDGVEKYLGELGSGETVGETDLVDRQPRMSNARAIRDTQLVRISPRGFERLVREHVEALNKIATILAGRMRAMVSRKQRVPVLRTIAILGAGESASFSEFTTGLCEALSTFGPVLHLNEQRFERMFGRPFDANSEIVPWLSELEQDYRFVVFEALCSVRHADRVLLVGRAEASTALNAAEQLLLQESAARPSAPLELVLIHEPSGHSFPGTAKWLAARPVVRHHHVRSRVREDLGRLARILAGCSIGLTLGGGGARGFAHIGVIRALEEARIPIDMICGVSMGAIIAGQYAMGWDWPTMIRSNKRLLADKWLKADIAIPLFSLSSGRRFRNALKTCFGEVEIEDLWLNYFCTSCNLSSSQLVVHRRGRLWWSVNASNAIPGLLPPVLHGGQLLIDGGVLNNQPGDLLKEVCGGPVIVSTVSPRTDLAMDESFTEMPSAWRVLRSRLNPFETTIKVPGIPATLMRTLSVASRRKSLEVEQDADLCLHPPVECFGVDDRSKIEEIAEVGYEYTTKEIQIWKQNNRLPNYLNID